jgi:hypothetical protein
MHKLLRLVSPAALLIFLALHPSTTLLVKAADAPAKNDTKSHDAALRKFLISTEGTYGWSPVKGTISYDFFPDGRLHIQGPDGEATMWEGTWSLVGNQLTLVNKDKKEKKTVAAKIDGKDLLLDGARYRRYRP